MVILVMDSTNMPGLTSPMARCNIMLGCEVLCQTAGIVEVDLGLDDTFADEAIWQKDEGFSQKPQMPLQPATTLDELLGPNQKNMFYERLILDEPGVRGDCLQILPANPLL
eukprot:605909-Amphidinium_carterae.2